jgi:hypothetical protein
MAAYMSAHYRAQEQSYREFRLNVVWVASYTEVPRLLDELHRTDLDN